MWSPSPATAAINTSRRCSTTTGCASRLISRPQAGDLSDYIALRHDEGATVTAAPDDTLSTVLARMRLYDISQLPVLDNNKVVGIIDEWDLLRHIGEMPIASPSRDGGHDASG